MCQVWCMLLVYLLCVVQIFEQDLFDVGGVLVLVGLVGVGKIIILVKMVVCYVFKYGVQSLVLVSMDSYWIGVQEQIKIFGWIFNVLVILVDFGQLLIQVLVLLVCKCMVLIDIVGLLVSDLVLCMQFEVLVLLSLNVKNYLVMVIISQSQVFKLVYQIYWYCGLVGCILIKLDEVGSFGELMVLVIVQCFLVVYLVDGLWILDDLQVVCSY